MLFPNQKVVFVHIPKTGGSSTEFLLGKGFYPQDYESYKSKNKEAFLSHLYGKHPVPGNHKIHRFAKYYKEHLGEKFEDYFRFSIIRNPFEQIRSLYSQLTEKQLNGASFEDFVNCKSPSNIETFEYYVDQLSYIKDGDDLLVDYLFPFDGLSEMFDELASRFDFEIEEQPRLWKTKSSDLLYTPEMIKKVLHMYGETWTLYNYVVNNYSAKGK